MQDKEGGMPRPIRLTVYGRAQMTEGMFLGKPEPAMGYDVEVKNFGDASGWGCTPPSPKGILPGDRPAIIMYTNGSFECFSMLGFQSQLDELALHEGLSGRLCRRLRRARQHSDGRNRAL